MRRLMCVGVVMSGLACAPGPRDPVTPHYGGVFDGTAGRWIDLTHAFSDSTIYWPTDTAGFQLEELSFGPTDGGWFYASYQFSSAEHGGTHLGAPIHFAEGRWTNDQIPLSALMGPAAVVAVTARATPDY
jgi:kynurenine formamidase